MRLVAVTNQSVLPFAKHTIRSPKSLAIQTPVAPPDGLTLRFAATSATPSPEEVDPPDLLGDAIALLQQGKLIAARRHINALMLGLTAFNPEDEALKQAYAVAAVICEAASGSREEATPYYLAAMGKPIPLNELFRHHAESRETAGDLETACEMWEMTGKAAVHLLGEGASETVFPFSHAAELALQMRELDQAERLSFDALRRIQSAGETGSFSKVLAHERLGRIYGLQQKTDAAAKQYDLAIGALKANRLDEDEFLAALHQGKANVFIEANRYDEAEPPLLHALAILRQKQPPKGDGRYLHLFCTGFILANNYRLAGNDQSFGRMLNMLGDLRPMLDEQNETHRHLIETFDELKKAA